MNAWAAAGIRPKKLFILFIVLYNAAPSGTEIVGNRQFKRPEHAGGALCALDSGEVAQ